MHRILALACLLAVPPAVSAETEVRVFAELPDTPEGICNV